MSVNVRLPSGTGSVLGPRDGHEDTGSGYGTRATQQITGDGPRGGSHKSSIMPKPFDAASKYLFEADPAAWLAFFGIEPGGLVSVVDTDLSTVTSDADKVIRIDAAEPWLVHVEVQAGYDADLARRLLRYNVLSRRSATCPAKTCPMCSLGSRSASATRCRSRWARTSGSRRGP